MKVEFAVADANRAGSKFPRHTVEVLDSNNSDPSAPLNVYFDGECPVCRIEVAFYKRCDRNARLLWIDIVKLADEELPAGKTREDLLRRFHVIDEGGTWHVGVDAFAAIWSELPGFRYFAWVFRAPGLRQLAGMAYRGFLFWQRRHRAKRVLGNQ